MKDRLLKSLSISVVTLLVVFATAVVTANAQSSQRVYAQIPFNFVVGDKTLSAGKYSISSEMQDGGALLIRSTNVKEAAMRLTDGIQSRSSKNNSRLVFHRYGQTYFLAEVWESGVSTGRALHMSKAERALQRERTQVAQNNSYETVELIASLR